MKSSQDHADICKNVQGHRDTETVPAGILSRKGQPGKVHRHTLASRHKEMSPISGHALHVDATAYALYGRTSTGTVTAPGTIAVDPRVIPYGSKIYVPGYGWGTAVDCGGAIQGHIIDLWMPSNGQCYQWGRRGVDIIVQPPPGKSTH